MKLPSHEECMNYFDDYKVPDNIKQHCLTVWMAARVLAIRLEKIGVQIDQRLVECLAILHDLFKMVSISDFGKGVHGEAAITDEQRKMWVHLRERFPGMNEGSVAYLIFKDQYPELALSLQKVCNPTIENKMVEEDLVHYCDWRVFQNTIVSIKTRMEYLQKHYTRDPREWDEFAGKILSIEKKIFCLLDFTPEELGNKIGKEALA